MKLFGFELKEIEEGRIVGELSVDQKHQQQNGFLHGGVVSTMSDIVMGFAAFSLVPSTHHVVTGELRVSYLSPGRFSRVEAIGWVLKPGKKLHFCEAEIWGVDGEKRKLLAKASSVMAVIFPEDFHPNS